MSEATPLLPKAKRPRNGSTSSTTRALTYLAGGILVFVLMSLFTEESQLARKNAFKKQLFSHLSNSTLADYSKHYYQSGSHLAGQNEELVKWTAQSFEHFGWSTEIATYDVYLNYPVDHRVALVNGSDVVYELGLDEDPIDGDEATSSPDRVPTFHGYSASGNVTGELVYANYGRKRDFEQLEARGIDLRGKVAIVRYGVIFRGLKVKFAEQHGMAAVLIYSDPASDGDFTEHNGYKQYPHGPARHESSVERGSVQDMTQGPGDPTTPGYGSLPGVNRTEPAGLPTIPSLPISFRDAKPLLEALNGHGIIFGGWQGALPGVDYATGPSTLQVNVFNEQEYAVRPIHNVIATLQGESDEQIIIGNHRDAWVLGAADPNSGSVVVMELARVLGKLHKQGWRPSRTIVIASWDGEEYGLLGSTEFGEHHYHHLSENTLAYINCDLAYSGSELEIGASPLLKQLIYRATKSVTSPFDAAKTLYQKWASQPTGDHIKVLGSGSDFTVFQDHIGIPSLDLSFVWTPGDNVYHYHSNYDSYYWMTHFGDPTYQVHLSLARLIGLLAIELAETPLVPFTLAPYAEAIETSLSKLVGTDQQVKKQVKGLQRTVEEFGQVAAKFDAYVNILRSKSAVNWRWWQFPQKFLFQRRMKAANNKLFYLERQLIHKKGLDERKWFKHMFAAPDRETGYAGQVLPGIAEAIDDCDWDKLSRWASRLDKAIKSVIETID